MSVGIVVPLPAYTLDPAFIAKKAEELGFESIFYHEHPILPVNSVSPRETLRTWAEQTQWRSAASREEMSQGHETDPQGMPRRSTQGR